MNKPPLIAMLVLFLISLSSITTGQAFQTDPAGQCAEGDRLFGEGKPAEALPQLEAGFAGRERATFTL